MVPTVLSHLSRLPPFAYLSTMLTIAFAFLSLQFFAAASPLQASHDGNLKHISLTRRQLPDPTAAVNADDLVQQMDETIA